MRKILRSNYIFDGENSPFKGYIAFSGEKIEEIKKDWSYQGLGRIAYSRFTGTA